jgi:hypothetical protein
VTLENLAILSFDTLSADQRRSLAIEPHLGASLLFSFAPRVYSKEAWRKPAALARLHIVELGH